MWYKISWDSREILVLVVGGRVAVCESLVFTIGMLETELIETCKLHKMLVDFASH